MYTVYVVRARIGKVQGKYDTSPKAALGIVAGAPASILPLGALERGAVDHDLAAKWIQEGCR